MASRGSISSIKENLAMPRSPTRSNSGSKRSLSMIQNRSSIIGIDQQQQPVSQSTAAGWISGISEVMANVSSRVVNTRAQEHHQQQYPLGNLSGPIMEQHSDGEQVMVDHTAIERRSTSKMSTGSHGPGSNHDANRLSQPERQDSRGLLLQTSNSGSNLGNTSALQDKVTQDDDEESIFVPGGFAHRGTDSMKLEGRSLWIFGPNNRLRVWLATILMSK
ncbi:hypothetical protein BG004_004357 [Podila humilis]|nr:hypothetical protein BG004_004357 [Podila humilis]